MRSNRRHTDYFIQNVNACINSCIKIMLNLHNGLHKAWSVCQMFTKRSIQIDVFIVFTLAKLFLACD